ncbi:MAG TPA: sugar phosphate isomerase/epimerase family protein [Bryobacteraceae bacterium]|nr:sugar phosphate isomerase/epimerase family protein [Bryobacteraceae bacterium]
MPIQQPLSLHPCIVGWRLPWPALAELAAKIGYGGAVIAREQVLPAAARGRVPATAMQLAAEVRRDEATFLSSLPRLHSAGRFADEVGCRVAYVGLSPSSEQPRDIQAAIYRERLRRCCEILDEYSIRLALECITPLHMRKAHPYEFIWRNAEMLDLGLAVSPRCGLVIDSWHWHHAGADPDWIRTIPAERILDVHIADSPAALPEDIRDSERLLPGEGVLNFRTFFDLLEEKEYRGAYTAEVFSSRLSAMDPESAARLAFEAATATVRNCGRRPLASTGSATAPDSAEA